MFLSLVILIVEQKSIKHQRRVEELLKEKNDLLRMDMNQRRMHLEWRRQPIPLRRPTKFEEVFGKIKENEKRK